jgi:D-alanyl-D-alanine carboxypeptidase
MKKWLFILILVLLLGCVYVLYKPRVVSPVNDQTIKVSRDQIYQGNLLLINKDNPVRPESKKTDVVVLSEHKDLIKGYRVMDNTIKASQAVIKNFSTMVYAAKNEGVDHFLINSGYRDFQEQDKLYRQKGPHFALPGGHSEHNLGLSIDIGSTQTAMYKAAEGRWLKKNAWKYGFILRYPLDKVAITGIQYEPWHFRYVGLPHSIIMKKENMTLEEYLDFLKNKKSFSKMINGKKYTIFYYRVADNITIPIPENHHYRISGNNSDGVIVTIWP